MFLGHEINEEFIENINKIQSWWKYMHKIINIQKVFRGFIIRKNNNSILKFLYTINRWQKILDKIKARRVLRNLVHNNNTKSLKKNNDMNANDFMSNVRRGKLFLNSVNKFNYIKSLKNNGKDINHPKKSPIYMDYSKNEENDEKNNKANRNSYVNNKNYNNNLNRNKNKDKSLPKDKKDENLCLTEEHYIKNDAINKIDKIGNNVKDYLKYKKQNKEDINNNPNDKNILYIDKVYNQHYRPQKQPIFERNIKTLPQQESNNDNKDNNLDDLSLKNNSLEENDNNNKSKYKSDIISSPYTIENNKIKKIV